MVNYDALEKEVSEYLLEICEIINKKWWISLLFVI
jgi:hypothetical protein